jgi:hypothetical protein
MERTLLDTALAITATEPAGRVWAFLVFCGLVEPESVEVIDALRENPRSLAPATPRAGLPDADGALAQRLWRYFEVGRQLTQEQVDAMSPATPKPAGWHGRARPCIEITD